MHHHSNFRFHSRILAVLLGVLFQAAPARPELVDRVVAVAGGRAVTWSAAVAQANYEAFHAGQEPVRLSAEDITAREFLHPIITRLVDQLLIGQAQQRALLEVAGEVAGDNSGAVLMELRKRYPAESEFLNALQRYGLSEAELVERLKREQRIRAFTEYSLRPQARVTGEQVDNYFRNTLLPQLQAAQPGLVPPELELVRGQIEEILLEKELNRLLDPWLADLRRESRVRFLFAPGGGQNEPRAR